MGQLANWIKQMLKDRGENQSELAVAIGKSQGTVNSWIRRNVIPENITLMLLARHFGIGFDEVVGYAESDRSGKRMTHHELERQIVFATKVKPDEEGEWIDIKDLPEEDKKIIKAFLDRKLEKQSKK